MALTAKQVTEVDNELTQLLLTSQIAGIKALYIVAGTSGYAALDTLMLTEWSKVTANLWNQTAPTISP